MSSFLNSLNKFWHSYYQFLKAEDRQRNMTPKEYGIMLQKKRRNKKKKAGAK